MAEVNFWLDFPQTVCLCVVSECSWISLYCFIPYVRLLFYAVGLEKMQEITFVFWLSFVKSSGKLVIFYFSACEFHLFWNFLVKRQRKYFFGERLTEFLVKINSWVYLLILKTKFCLIKVKGSDDSFLSIIEIRFWWSIICTIAKFWD